MEHLNDLDYADDIVLLSKKERHMQSKLNDMAKYAETVGLHINVEKTKSIKINSTRTENFTLGDRSIEDVHDYTYLGSQIAADGGGRLDVECRIKKAKGAFARLKNIWHSRQLAAQTKLRIFNSNVKSVLLYGCETWMESDEVNGKLQAFMNRCMRNILGLWWPGNWITNVELYRRCKQDPINLQIRERKWRWIGHTLRKPHTEICKAALDWNPQGKRSRGRPRGTWRRSLEEDIARTNQNQSWLQVKATANNRRKWNSFTMALCANNRR